MEPEQDLWGDGTQHRKRIDPQRRSYIDGSVNPLYDVPELEPWEKEPLNIYQQEFKGKDPNIALDPWFRGRKGKNWELVEGSQGRKFRRRGRDDQGSGSFAYYTEDMSREEIERHIKIYKESQNFQRMWALERDLLRANIDHYKKNLETVKARLAKWKEAQERHKDKAKDPQYLGDMVNIARRAANIEVLERALVTIPRRIAYFENQFKYVGKDRRHNDNPKTYLERSAYRLSQLAAESNYSQTYRAFDTGNFENTPPRYKAYEIDPEEKSNRSFNDYITGLRSRIVKHLKPGYETYDAL